jgi:intracellular septation protein
MLAFLDLVPVVIFVAAYRLYGIYEATLALIIAMVAVIVVHWLVKGTVSRMLLISGAFAVVLGGITIWLQNPLFLQWKPTVVYWIFAVVLLGMDLLSPRNVFARMLGENIEVSRHAWRVLNTVWVVMFAAMGFVNIYVAYTYDMSTWVNFKLYLAIASMVLGFAVTALFLYRYMPKDEEDSAAEIAEKAPDAEEP